MLEFIKMFGMGILYTILFPFIIAIFALYVVYVFGNYLVFEAINFFGFFFGYSFTSQTELEKKLENMKDNNDSEKTDANNMEEEFEEFFMQENIFDDLKGSDEHE